MQHGMRDPRHFGDGGRSRTVVALGEKFLLGRLQNKLFFIHVFVINNFD